MKTSSRIPFTVLLCLGLVLPLLPLSAAASDWPSFRGPDARGVAEGVSLPASWDVKSGEGVRWATEIPGLSHASPIVWGDQLFVITAVSADAEKLVLGDAGGIAQAKDSGTFSWRIYALDRTSGKILWNQEAYSGKPRSSRHVKSSQANSTPATDGKTLVAIFGSQGLVAFDLAGKELWRKDLGVLDPGLHGDPGSQWGHASSPVIHDGRVFVQVDRHKGSYLAAYEAATGKQLWRVERNEKPVWATPVILEHGGRTELVVVGGDFDRGYDPATGKELWRFPRDYEVKTPTPVVAGDLVVFSGGYRGQPLYAVKAGAKGAVSAAWTSEKGGPYTSTPLAHAGLIYFVRDTGILTVLDLATGERLHRERLGSTFSASPVAGDGKIYLTGEEGVVTVISPGREPKVLASNDFGEPTMATPAIAGDTLFFRTQSKVVAVGGETSPKAAPKATPKAKAGEGEAKAEH